MSIYSEAVAELVAVGAAIASNCEPCLKYHYKRAVEMGVSHEDLALAILTAHQVKETPARRVLSLAERLGGGDQAEVSEKSEDIERCCASATAKKSCCGS